MVRIPYFFIICVFILLLLGCSNTSPLPAIPETQIPASTTTVPHSDTGIAQEKEIMMSRINTEYSQYLDESISAEDIYNLMVLNLHDQEIRNLLESNKRFGVIIVDMQYDWIEVSDEKSMVNNQLEVMDFSNDHDIPVILLSYDVEQPTLKRITDKIDTSKRNFVIVKRDYNGFIEENMKTLVKELDIDYLFIMGMLTSTCVYATAKGATEEGHSFIIAKDVINKMCSGSAENDCSDVTGNDVEGHKKALKYFDTNGILLESYLDFFVIYNIFNN
ncbi:MAG: isochorismatase family protein [Nanoarchaeota archaeon]|nr:isochorismatase family protein [Nanoarchaeota archaeon]